MDSFRIQRTRGLPCSRIFAIVASCIIVILVIGSNLQLAHDGLKYHSLSRDSSLIKDERLGTWATDRKQHPNVTSERGLWKNRTGQVKDSFLHAWRNYEQYAWAKDELRPLSKSTQQNYYGWGVSIVDSLDTLLLMDLKADFAKAMDHVDQLKFHMSNYESGSFFEIVIRYLGGLLSAYALIQDNGLNSGVKWQTQVSPSGKTWDRDRIAQVLLAKADHLASALSPAFNTKSGLPLHGINTVTGQRRPSVWAPGAMLAEIGSCQMEYKYLAHLTGKKTYFSTVDHVTQLLHKLQAEQIKSKSELGGMLPTFYNGETGKPIGNFISVGTLTDSAYEYFLKTYLLTGRNETQSLDLYLSSVTTALERLVYITPNRNLTYVTDMDATSPTPSHRQEHLACFFSGLLALGVGSLNPSKEVDKKTLQRHLFTAEALAETCYVTYADRPTYLGPEEVLFDGKTSNKWMDVMLEWERSPNGTAAPRGVHGSDAQLLRKENDIMDYKLKSHNWPMRPETIESLSILFRQTGNPVWRERCYAIYKGMEKFSRVENGFGSVLNVEVDYVRQVDDEMPSWALAETFKYLYLCMMDPADSTKLIPPQKWVFTTEAHPLPVFEWSKKEVVDFEIGTKP